MMKQLIYMFLVVAAVMTLSFNLHSRKSEGVATATEQVTPYKVASELYRLGHYMWPEAAAEPAPFGDDMPPQAGVKQDTLRVEDFEARIEFEKPTVNLGEMTAESGKQKFEFKFVNSGNAPLVLTYVHASCSCIGLDYPRAPIAPGDSASIKGFLNPGAISEADFKRNILIRSNANPSQHRIFIVGKLRK